MRKSRRIAALLAVALVGAGLVAYFAWLRPAPNDTTHSGAYRFDDGSLAFVTPRDGEQLRIRWMDGRSHVLWPVARGEYEVGAGFSEREPATGVLRFDDPAPGSSAILRGPDGRETRMEPLPLREEPLTFRSGEVELHGKLVLPDGEGPFAGVVIVHGSESTSAVETYFHPYLFAAHGTATLVFDKRGTGKSGGSYTQNFHVLSDDVVAAVRRMRAVPGIDHSAVHLAGFSQGGWIAPLAAMKDGDIRSFLVGYGPAVPVTQEDRWGYVHELERHGFGSGAVEAADRINAEIEAIMDRGEDRWRELERGLEEAAEAPWSEAIEGSDSVLGYMAGSRMPTWVMKLYAWWLRRGDVPFIDRTYDPAPTLASLDVPSLWLLGSEDHSTPTEWTLGVLDSLRAEGRPIERLVFDGADHGILLFEEAGGERRYTRYAPGYHRAMVEWLHAHAGESGGASGGLP